jgi:HPt (histidine-containing phosphotransfer) domain-containing protein
MTWDADAMMLTMPTYDARALHAKALELACDDRRVAMRLLEMIAETNRTTLASLQESVAASSWDAVAGAAHRIAGSARLLDCGELITLLAAIEAAARERQQPVVGKLMPLLVDALASLKLLIDAAVGDVRFALS